MKLRFWLCALLLLVLPVGVCAAEVDSDSVYCFSQADFGGETGIFLRSVPENGSLTLGQRLLRPGDALTREQLAQVVFTPARTETDGQAQVCYLPVGDSVGPEAVLTLGIRGKENKAPVAEDSTLETYKNLQNTGVLRAKDPEGEPLTFAITRNPRRGEVVLGENGSFTYTPKNNKVGVDSFAYTATDPQGKQSREATVTVTILKPSTGDAYTDTAGTSCAFSAEWMRSTGIFSGEVLAGKACFGPKKAVSKGEFLTMVVKTLSIPVEERVSAEVKTNLPQWLRPYAVAALRTGLTTDTPWQGDFDENAPVTCAEAAALVQGCFGPENIDALAEQNLLPEGEDALTREECANLLYRLQEAARV